MIETTVLPCFLSLYNSFKYQYLPLYNEKCPKKFRIPVWNLKSYWNKKKPFYHTDLKNTLENIVFKGKSIKEKEQKKPWQIKRQDQEQHILTQK